MESQNNNSRKIGIFIVFSVFLVACIAPAKSPQNPVVESTESINVPASVHPATFTPNAPRSDTPMEVFSIQEVNKIAPDDVLKEISFSATGGHDGSICDTAKIYSKPTLEYAPVKAEWLDPFGIGIIICGWRADEIVSLTMTFPDGSILNEKLKAAYDDTEGTAYTFYSNPIPSVNDQIGIYSFLFEGESGKVSHSINVYISTEPRLYPLYDKETLIVTAFFLYGYSPNERVRFVFYGWSSESGRFDIYSLTAWNDYRVDSKGQLIIKITDEFGGYYVAVGDISGVNRNSAYDILAVTTSPSSIATSCNSNLPSRLQIGEYAYVATDPPLNQRVREDAGRNYSVVGHITPGSSMEILDGPKCADGWAWWMVQSIKKPDLIGWTSEGDDVYWLIPCRSLDSCP